jgi:hypothetical protein
MAHGPFGSVRQVSTLTGKAAPMMLDAERPGDDAIIPKLVFDAEELVECTQRYETWNEDGEWREQPIGEDKDGD